MYTNEFINNLSPKYEGKSFIMKFISILTAVICVLMIQANPVLGVTAGQKNREGVDLGNKRKYREAIDEFNQSIEKYNRESALAYHNRGWANELMGENEQAVKSYEEALYRNPKQIVTGEKLGYLYYRTGDYPNAVRVGEFVLKQDPKNKEVPKWLADAYMKKLELEKKQEEARKEEEKKKEQEKKETAENRQIEEEKKKEQDILLYATFDCMIRTGYFFRGNKGYRYVSDPGSIVDIPENLFIRFTPRKKAEFSLYAGNPFLGALTPNVLAHSEVFEGMYRIGRYKMGAGVMINHYDGSISFGKKTSLTDAKIGILFGFEKDKLEMRFSLYPRFLPHDGSASSGKTYDTDKFQVDYLYRLDESLSVYSVFSMNDFYLFDHTNKTSDYWGMYDLGIGVSLGKVDTGTKKMELSGAIEFHEHLYFKDIGNDDPYGFLNGQGLFGMNSGKWLKGDPFSGFHAFGHELSFKVQEKFSRYFFLYQKFSAEMGDMDEDHHEFNFLFGAGAVY